MNQPPSEKEIIEIASHLRKPTGDKGLKIAEMMNDGNLPMNLHTLAVVNPQANEQLLEIGMANGFFVKNLLSIDKTIQYTGLDYSETMVQEAIARNKDYTQTKQASFLKGDIHSLPFNDNSFDKIFTINTLYFWEDPIKALQEIRRVLKPDGTFILSVRPKRNLKQFPVTKYNFKLLKTSEIISMLKDNGFHNIEKTEIKEPEQERWGKVFQRETLILNCTT